jgi:hypothetical protein
MAGSVQKISCATLRGYADGDNSRIIRRLAHEDFPREISTGFTEVFPRRASPFAFAAVYSGTAHLCKKQLLDILLDISFGDRK